MFRLWELLIYGHVHLWKEVSYLNYLDTSWGEKHPKQFITYKCEVCAKHKTEMAEGFRG